VGDYAALVLKILIADDHALVRSGMQQLLTRLDDDVCCHESENAAGAVAIVRSEPALDLVLLDLDLPDCHGLELLGQLVRDFPLVPVIMVSATAEPNIIRTAIDMGAMGFIPKAAPPEVTLQAIRLVLAGEVYVPVAALRGARSAQAVQHLTPRQQSVLTLLVLGRTNKAIARELGLAEATVKVHVTTLLHLLDASNRTEAAQRARELGLLDRSQGG